MSTAKTKKSPLLQPAKTPKEKNVPCGSCTVCCQGDSTFLYPGYGDDVSSYEIAYQDGRVMLAHKDNRDCIYLDREKGCTIRDRRPAVCRELDCRDLLLLPKRMRKLIRRDVYKAAKRLKRKKTVGGNV